MFSQVLRGYAQRTFVNRWIQWEGTDVCMDLHCKCGETPHVDADFMYHVKCPSCGTVYFRNGHIEHIELIELEVEPDHCVVTAQE